MAKGGTIRDQSSAIPKPKTHKAEIADRSMRYYLFSFTEMATLSVLNPASVFFLGFGVTGLIKWIDMPAGDSRTLLLQVSTASLGFGVLLQMVSFGIILIVWIQSMRRR